MRVNSSLLARTYAEIKRPAADTPGPLTLSSPQSSPETRTTEKRRAFFFLRIAANNILRFWASRSSLNGVMDWISKLFDIGKLPTKIVTWIAIFSGALLFAPPRVLASLRLDTFVKDYGFYIGLAFLGSAILLAINIILALWRSLLRWSSSRKWRSGLRDTVATFDAAEKAVLREFFIQGKNTLRLPVDDPAVSALRRKQILQLVGELGEGSLVGVLFPLAIHPEARAVLTAKSLDLPAGQPTDADRNRILDSRPPFMKRLAEMDWLRNG